MFTRPGTASLAALAGMLAWSGAAMAETDLGSLLVPAPSEDWVQADANPTNGIGPFDALDYTVYENDGGVAARALNRDGFVGGYGRYWVQLGTRDGLIERVFQFNSNSGALSWYGELKMGNQTAKQFKRNIPALGPNVRASFGAELDFSDGWRDYRVEFAKGNYFFAVHMGSFTSDLSAAVLAQGEKQYDAAPQPTSAPIDLRAAATNPAPLLIGGAIGIGLILAVTVVVIVVLAVRGRRLTAASPVPAATGVQTSPDGLYWWDGGRWRVVATDPPPRP
ncbi:MAG TPA: hypothetical protein VFL27_07530 [Candidatus Dormibacteraeota bacterium]|nr:hypothetical protein [Candidatus Dormibacteraeota bacterium]